MRKSILIGILTFIFSAIFFNIFYIKGDISISIMIIFCICGLLIGIFVTEILHFIFITNRCIEILKTNEKQDDLFVFNCIKSDYLVFYKGIYEYCRRLAVKQLNLRGRSRKKRG